MTATVRALRGIAAPVSAVALVVILAGPLGMDVHPPQLNPPPPASTPGDPAVPSSPGVVTVPVIGTRSGDGTASTPRPATDPCARSSTSTGASSRPAARATTATVCVGIPRVAFTADVRVVDGRLRTPVLINAGAVPGVIRVVGAGSGNECTLAATPGVVAWLDCRIKATGRSMPTIVVRLRDGTTVTRSITVP